jgi:pimeloyl-ACP methyl ester carboxylesterase
MVAIATSYAHPELFKAMVLIDTSFKPTYLTDPYVSNTLFVKTIRMALHFSSKKHKYAHIDFSQFIGTADYDWRRIINDILHASLRSYLLACSVFLQFDARKMLKELELPTLVITGNKDQIFPPSIAQKLKNRIKKAHLVHILKGNHITVVNNPLEVSLDIYHFLKKMS